MTPNSNFASSGQNNRVARSKILKRLFHDEPQHPPLLLLCGNSHSSPRGFYTHGGGRATRVNSSNTGSSSHSGHLGRRYVAWDRETTERTWEMQMQQAGVQGLFFFPLLLLLQDYEVVGFLQSGCSPKVLPSRRPWDVEVGVRCCSSELWC